ncbi:serine/threonine-protein kinase [Mycobacterium bourgelatii]|uniref:non-specific serine/threonine protein kinase n=1 Tax=Mycobacterium bourgelatii TaxID=1273442 RepID=A0A7I9YSM1_MYCBU|nr:serine/threonine-protein kinase [Mycobacterium bourgelatii]MCV6977048.1 serine/threonine protein kinase [Mycobacterium bourgelatii]GFG91547.1 hypothetical protein MBOU_35890 [Mycobacterium bourgelatii]
MSLEVGQEFAGYTIVRKLGAGGMGAVYLARHPRLPREDALKVLPADVTNDPHYRARFEREAEIAAALSHPSIVGIHDRGEYEGRLWISMDYVDGTDAAELLATRYTGGMPVDEVVAIITAVASALDYAHHRGLLHRDVKPANILLTQPDGQPRRVFLADFGIARRMDDAARLTQTNMAVGTAAYAAPEQLMGESLDGRADQYALACTAFHLLTGTRPYSDSNLAVVISQQVTAPPPSIAARRPELAALDPVFATAMAKHSAQRFASCQEFAQQLEQYLTDASYVFETRAAPVVTVPEADGRRRRSPLLVGALAAVVLLVVAVGIFAGVALTQQQGPTATASGPLAGTYRADFGPTIGLDAPPSLGTTALTATYGLRSVCETGGCVATATRRGGAQLGPAALVFDQIGGRWVFVAVDPGQCEGAAADSWQVMTLQPGSDGTLSGEYTTNTGGSCVERRTVTFTRIGDADLNDISDPARQPKRVVSPAEALRGHYHLTRTFTDGSPPLQASLAGTTYCLRTGDRCTSFLHDAFGGLPMVFADGVWTYAIQREDTCPTSGANAQVQVTGQFSVPQVPQDPITTLSGHGHQSISDSCGDSDFDETLTRTGD